MTRSRSVPGALGLGALLLLTPPALAGGGAKPGDYCPLPEKGKVSTCLAPARETYTEFFTALDRDPKEDDADLATVEAVLAGGAGEEQAYLALSSIAYGYYRLAQRAAAAESTDPLITRRLARWNDLLALAYHESPQDARYRSAVRQAAEELNDRARISLPCRGPEGEPAACNSTEHVLRGIDAATERVGIRGALGRVLQRFFGGGDS